jgi:hypothetical protein
MKKAVIGLAILGLLFLALPALAGQPKEDDVDMNYDEGRVIGYELPPLLVTAEGKAVTTPEEWRNIRRPQILALFSNFIYGSVPQPQSPIKSTADVVKTDPEFLDGKATRKDIRIKFINDRGKAEMLVLVFVPNKAEKPVPALMVHSFDNTRSGAFKANSDDKTKLGNGWPLGDLLDRGYALVAVSQDNLVAHNEVEFQKGIHPLFYHDGQSFPKASEWGVIAAIAWGGMRALDYLETDKDIDAKRVAIMGHSKCGKAALWTAAQDERFALAVAAESGCAGAALWNRNVGETMDKMVTRFPYWLCRNAWNFAGREKDLPVDQHMLLGLIAPRPVYVYSGVDDKWADPRGEYLGAYHAGEAYRLLGKTALESEKSPEPGKPVTKSDVGYHLREGGHSVEPYDWERIMDFMDYHLKK